MFNNEKFIYFEIELQIGICKCLMKTWLKINQDVFFTVK